VTSEQFIKILFTTDIASVKVVLSACYSLCSMHLTFISLYFFGDSMASNNTQPSAQDDKLFFGQQQPINECCIAQNI